MSHSKRSKYQILRISLLVMFIATPLLLHGSNSIAEMQQTQVASSKIAQRPIPLILMPKGQYGSVDWVQGAKDGLILPLASLKNNEIKVVNLNYEAIIMKPNNKKISDILFPHTLHADLLNCESCHSSIFSKEREATKGLSVASIKKGEFCGACHGKVSFRLNECDRCHIERDQQNQYGKTNKNVKPKVSVIQSLPSNKS